ncbi:MAG: hypothetical protein IPM56_10735 [Ignavibacteriales bacterium]|nr:MAG: hypothetical protein IPM56_10735 [Ignavibacteriales bacterium]
MADFLDIVSKIVTVSAILTGGVWAYYKYIKGRLFYPRIELQINGELKIINSFPHLMLNYQVKNIGLSKVDLDKEASGIRVMKYNPPDDSLEIESADWKLIGSFYVLNKHSWIESSETIKESGLFSITQIDNTVYKVELRIVGKGKSWEAMDILFCNSGGKES